ncbi:MAG: hypothetical protein U0166_04920 [Acidobacteriota bacterium]
MRVRAAATLVLGATLWAAEPPKPATTVTPAAEVEIQTFVVQDKALKPISTDKAKLAVGKKGGIKKKVTLTPGKKSKATGSMDVDVKIVVSPTASTTVGVELEIESTATAPGAKAPVATRMKVTLDESATKLLNVYEYEPFGARVMATIKAHNTDPIVVVEGLNPGKGPALAPSTKDLKPVSFQVDIKRIENGEPVYEEQPSLVTWVGKPANYEITYQIPIEMVPSQTEKGKGDVRYATEKAQIALVPSSITEPEMRLDAHVKSVIYQGSDLQNGFAIDRTVPFIVKHGESFELYAIYGQDDVQHLDSSKRAKASGYIFRVTPTF